MGTRFFLQLGDITSMNVEAIVNSSDSTLLDGGPVHAAVHGAAGPGLREECAALQGCPVGEARITAAHGLGARFIIHTVAPTWNWGSPAEEQALARCYRSSLELAAARNIRSLAFPSIGSGRQPQIPLERAAPVAVATILDHLNTHILPEKVILVCFDTLTFQAYQRALKEALP
jgi:O-acetyl-ADP-ribose deacetylase (regulator of RNase III)